MERSYYYIKHLEVNNFKSFQDPITFVFGRNVNAVIDTNGADEWNLVEAVSMALCDQQSREKEKSVRTQLVNEIEGSIKITISNDENADQTFSRIFTGSECQFRVNEEIVNRDVYVRRLKDVGMHASSQLLLLPRGQAQTIASKKPQQLCAYFEEVAYDSDPVKERYLRMKAAVAKAQLDINRAKLKRKREKDEESMGQIFFSCSQKYIQLTTKHDNYQIESILFQFYHYARMLDCIRPRLSKINADLKLRSGKLAPFIEEKRVAAIKLAEIKNNWIETQEKSKDLKAAYQKVRNQIESQTKIRERLQTSLAECDVNKLKKLKKDLKVAEKAREDFGRNVPTPDSAQNKERLKEYYRVKKEATKRSGRHFSELQGLKRRQSILQKELENSTSFLRSYEEKNARVDSFEADQERRREEMRNKIQVKKRELEKKNLKLKEAETAKKDIADITKLIDESSLNLFKHENYGKRKEASDETLRIVDALKRNFQTVYGRLGDVCQAKEAKYENAVNAALLEHKDVIIVDNFETLMKCLAYLRENGLESQTLLALTTVKVPQIAASLRNTMLPSHVKNLIDVVKYEPEVINAVLFATRNVLVCEAKKDFDYLRLGRDVKAVTLDGRFYGASGYQAFGKIDLNEQGERLDEASLNELVEKLKNLQTAKEDIESKAMTDSDMFRLEHDVETLEFEIRYNEEVLPSVRSLNPSITQNAKVMKAVRKHQACVADAQAELDKVREQIQRTEDIMRTLEEPVWAGFCEKFGFENIQKFEAIQEAERDRGDARNKQEITLDNAIKDLRLQITREERKDLLSERNRLAKELRCCEEELRRLNLEEPKLKKSYTEILRKLQDSNSNLESQKSAIDQLEAKMKPLKDDVDISQANATRWELEMAHIRCKRHFLLLNCKENCINVPFENGNLSRVKIIEEDYSKEDRFDFDFSSLPQDLKDITSDERIKEVEDEFKRKLKKMQSIIDNLMKDVGEGLAVDERKSEDRYTKEMKFLRAVEISAKNAFKQVKNERSDKILEAFSYVTGVIDAIYKDLNADASSSASLLLLNSNDEPYFCPIHFEIVSSGDAQLVRELSVEKKIMAALSLVFAIQSYQKSHVVILDNADFQLRAPNVLKLIKLIRNRSQQIIFLTAKEESYVRSDVVMRVCRQKTESRVFDINLAEYSRESL